MAAASEAVAVPSGAEAAAEVLEASAVAEASVQVAAVPRVAGSVEFKIQKEKF